MCIIEVMPNQNFIKNITSKDIKLSQNTIIDMIKTSNIESFKLLCEKSDFIFPFLKERISKDFVELIEKQDLKAVFEFSKNYCSDFEDLIVNSCLKFANEDLTDEIIGLFENGVDSQRAYLVKYFIKIKDSVVLEYLNKFAKSDYEPLKNNSAKVLAEFSDKTVLNEMKEIVLNSSDEFEKIGAYNFIANYNGVEQIKFILQNCFASPFSANILSNVLDNNEINYLKNILDETTLIKTLQVILEQYPEELSLDSVYYWNLFDFIKIVYSFKNQYAANVLLYARAKFKEFSENDIYTFDFDKNIKSEIKNISNLLNTLELEFNFIDNDDFQFNVSLNVIKEYKLDYAVILADLINKNDLSEEKIAAIASVLKSLDKINLINSQIIENIKDENIKALIQSYI